MDRTAVFGTADTGPIPVEGIYILRILVLLQMLL